MASPSVALLSAFVGGKGRPTRILVQDNAPAFVFNVSKIAGAVPVAVPLKDGGAGLDPLRGALADLSALSGPFWGVVMHRGGHLVGSDALSVLAFHNVPAIELCIGSLPSLARADPSSATVTIVSLDAEPALGGLNLTALLTSDEALATRIRRFCLPGHGAEDYVFDAAPRGLAEDETALLALVERLTSPEKPRGFGLSLKQFFLMPWSAGADASARADPPVLSPPVRRAALLGRIAELEGQLQQTIDEGKVNLAVVEERHATHTRAKEVALDEVKARLEAGQTERTALIERLVHAETVERELRAQLHTARKDHDRIERFAAEAAGAEATRAEFSEPRNRAESDLAAAGRRSGPEAKAKEEWDRTITSVTAERSALAEEVSRLQDAQREAQAALVRERALAAQGRDELGAQRDHATEVFRLTEALNEARESLETAKAAAEKDAAQIMSENRTVVARLQGELADVEAQGAAAEDARSAQAAALAVRVDVIEKEKALADARVRGLEREIDELRAELAIRDEAGVSPPTGPGPEIIDFESPAELAWSEQLKEERLRMLALRRTSAVSQDRERDYGPGPTGGEVHASRSESEFGG